MRGKSRGNSSQVCVAERKPGSIVRSRCSFGCKSALWGGLFFHCSLFKTSSAGSIWAQRNWGAHSAVQATLLVYVAKFNRAKQSKAKRTKVIKQFRRPLYVLPLFNIHFVCRCASSIKLIACSQTHPFSRAHQLRLDESLHSKVSKPLDTSALEWDLFPLKRLSSLATTWSSVLSQAR